MDAYMNKQRVNFCEC